VGRAFNDQRPDPQRKRDGQRGMPNGIEGRVCEEGRSDRHHRRHAVRAAGEY